MRDTQFLGIRTTWARREVIADVLVDGRVIVCLPEQFDGAELSSRGVWWKVVSPAELQDVVVLRVLATWRHLPIQIVATETSAEGPRAQIVYVGRDMFAAEAAGMAKTDAGVYELVVSATELEDLCEERRTVQLEPHAKSAT